MGWNKNTVVQSCISDVAEGVENLQIVGIHYGRGLNDHGRAQYVLCAGSVLTPKGKTLFVDTVHLHPDCDMDDVIKMQEISSLTTEVCLTPVVFDEEYHDENPLNEKAALQKITQFFVVKNKEEPSRKAFHLLTDETAAKSEALRLKAKFKKDFEVVALSDKDVLSNLRRGYFQGV